MKEYLEKSSKILDELQTTEQGLSEAEAARRLSEHGPNRLAAGKKKSNLQRFFEELKVINTKADEADDTEFHNLCK